MKRLYVTLPCEKETGFHLEFMSMIPRVLSKKNVESSLSWKTIGDLVSKETVCYVGGKVKHRKRFDLVVDNLF